jgi:hypothetical protein
MHRSNLPAVDSGNGRMVEPAEMLRYAFGYFAFFIWSQSRRREVSLP